MSDFVKLTGLWQKTNKQGDPIYVGRLGAARVMVLPNRDRKGDNEPTHNFVVVPVEEAQGQGGGGKSYSGNRQGWQPGNGGRGGGQQGNGGGGIQGGYGGDDRPF